MTPRPFEIRIPDSSIRDLNDRLRAARWPTSLDRESWNDGTSLSFVERLVDHWLHRFDWRAQEARLNRMPQYLMQVDGMDVHFVHRRGTGPSPLPLILTHGWPGSFAEMEHVIPLLADPGSHGGDPEDAFHVVVASLPGYGFSQAPSAPGVGSREIARSWRRLMEGLGYQRFGAQGGDIGASVSTWLARLHPKSMVGIHLNFIPGSFRPPLEGDMPPITATERDFRERGTAWSAAEGAYAALQGTKPQTLSFSLSDSPVGLAAWIAEKFQLWSDGPGDLPGTITIDTLLTDISLHWFSDDLTASLRLYKENRATPLAFAPGERVATPLGVAVFPRELPMPPRSWVERVFDVRRWTTMAAGGHFAALEQPGPLVDDIRAFFRPLRRDRR